jgi:y4mF family transcriptional regulator
MRINMPRDLGLYVRTRRRELGYTQVALAAQAGVSRRWLSDLEAGKATAEIGLILRTMRALKLDFLAHPYELSPPQVDLDQHLARLTHRRSDD